VNRQFIGVDEEFKSRFPGYSENTFDEIESALFGLPPGDSPLIPLEIHLFGTQGSMPASVRKAHVMVNHDSLEEAMNDILSEEEERAVGQVFAAVFEEASPYLKRRGRDAQPDSTKSLKDLWVKDEQTAQKLGLTEQYHMLEIFEQMLVDAMAFESA